MIRRLPTITAALFLALTLGRVASFTHSVMGAGWPNAVLFSAGMAVAIYTAAYFSRASGVMRKARKTKRRKVRMNARQFARIALIAFIACDGAFNLADSLRSLVDAAYMPFAIVYGIFPTLAAGLLGMLQGYVDRLPKRKGESRVITALMNKYGNFSRKAQVATKPTTVAEIETQPLAPELDTRGKVLAFYRNDPHGTFTACARDASVSRQRVAQIVKELEAEKVISRNGKVTVAQ